ncbi:MAG TPA: LamG-like jellyroll fold domain-containing protein, partial [Rariglobus sp.]
SGRTSASHGLSYRAGAAGAAFDFDGNAYVHEPGRSETNLGALSAGFTIEFWMWPAATDANSRRLIAWNSGTAENLRIYSSATGASLTLEESVQINANTSELRRLALTGLPTGRWVHVALAYDKVAKTLTFYVDGVVKQTSDAAGLPMKTQGDLTFGNSFAQASANGFKGGLDEVSFYDHPLTGADIIRIFTAGQQGKRPVTTNTPPLVFAGLDQELAANAGSVTLSGRVSDDGLPAAGGLTTTWTQSFGPAPVVLAHPEAAVTPATFTAPGIYGLTLTANDGMDTRGDSLEVRVGMPPGQAVPAGLRAWWPANASTEDVVSGLFGTPFNLHYMTGETGGAFSFDGNGYLVVPRGTATDLGALTAGFTIEFWMQSVATDANDRRLLVWSSGTSDGVRIYSSSSGTSLTVEEGVRINASSVEIRRISLGGVPTGRWVHVGLAYDKAAARLRFYIDGVLRSNASTSGIPLNALGDLHIGGSPNLTPANCFKGGLDEVSFYDRSLTADEIQQIFAAGTSGK